MPRKSPRPDLSHLPKEEVARGKAFARWLRESLILRDLSQKELADASGLRPGTISALYNDGYDKQLDKIRRPKPETIHKIAEATGADEDKGREAAGYASRTPHVFISHSAADKPLAETLLVAERLRSLAEEIEQAGGSYTDARRVHPQLDEDLVDLIEAYEGLSPDLKEITRENWSASLKSIQRLAKEVYQRRSDIIGKRSEEEGQEGDHGAGESDLDE